MARKVLVDSCSAISAGIERQHQLGQPTVGRHVQWPVELVSVEYDQPVRRHRLLQYGLNSHFQLGRAGRRDDDDSPVHA